MRSVPRFYIITSLFICFCIACGDTAEQPMATAQKATVATPKTTTMEKPSLPTTTQSAENFSLDYIMGKFEPAKDTRFVELSTKHADKKGMYLRKEVYEAFQKMYVTAAKDGIQLIIRSATRPFRHQKRIWEGKWTGNRLVEGKNLSKTIPFGKDRALKILEYSSMPGTSRHHWGTDFDINAFENAYFEKGEGKKIYDWMTKNAPLYGFCQPYTPKGSTRPDGYNEEKWHWSYLPISKPLTHQAKEKLKDTAIQGFRGAETAPEIEVVQKYVLGISSDCL